MRFRARLIVAASAMTLVTLGGAFAAVSFAVNRSQERQLDQALLAEAREEARESAAIGGGELAISDRPGPYANDVGPLTKYGAIYAPDGRVRAATSTFTCAVPSADRAAHPEGAPFDLSCGAEHLRAVRVPIPGHEGSSLLLAAPRTDLDGDEAFLARAMALALLVATIWAVAGSTWLVGRLTRDHQAVAAAARRVAAGDLTARVGMKTRDQEMAQLAGDVDDMIDQLQKLVASQQRFIAHAAHELRSPLTLLSGELQHALRKGRDAEAYRAAIEEAYYAAGRLSQLAEDLLTLAKVGHESEPVEEVAVESLVADVVRELAPLAAERSVSLRVAVADARAFGHSRALERMLRNLVENAIAHSPHGGEVLVRAASRGAVAELTVQDGGGGVAAEDDERIFEPFYRSARSRAARPTGTGLGLGIAREIARAHGGDITVESPDEGGARFVVRLRAKPA